MQRVSNLSFAAKPSYASATTPTTPAVNAGPLAVVPSFASAVKAGPTADKAAPLAVVENFPSFQIFALSDRTTALVVSPLESVGSLKELICDICVNGALDKI